MLQSIYMLSWHPESRLLHTFIWSTNNTSKRSSLIIQHFLNSLHWLPILARAHFKILLLTNKALNGLTPSCISSLITPYTPSSLLCSLDAGYLTAPQLIRKSFWGQSLCLPSFGKKNLLHTRDRSSVEIFKLRLKTPLFCIFYGLCYFCYMNSSFKFLTPFLFIITITLTLKAAKSCREDPFYMIWLNLNVQNTD